jgi:16S rRNA U516 pseudouridylate synthase RsuA-like enzyme
MHLKPATMHSTSRRVCEELIRQGRVAVDGRVAQLGQKADPHRGQITVDGRPVQMKRLCYSSRQLDLHLAAICI